MTFAQEVLPTFKNPSVDLAQEYGGMQLVQLKYDHENDQDDIVPELTNELKVEIKEEVKQKAIQDFAGQNYEETYDD